VRARKVRYREHQTNILAELHSVTLEPLRRKRESERERERRETERKRERESESGT